MDLAATNGMPAGISALASWFLPILYGAIGAIPSLLTLYTDFERSQDILSTTGVHTDGKMVYDFIVGKFRFPRVIFVVVGNIGVALIVCRSEGLLALVQFVPFDLSLVFMLEWSNFCVARISLHI